MEITRRGFFPTPPLFSDGRPPAVVSEKVPCTTVSSSQGRVCVHLVYCTRYEVLNFKKELFRLFFFFFLIITFAFQTNS